MKCVTMSDDDYYHLYCVIIEETAAALVTNNLWLLYNRAHIMPEVVAWVCGWGWGMFGATEFSMMFGCGFVH